jgi:hypothetical protein
MKTVQGKTFDRTTVTFDDTEFVNCTMTNCELIYSGGPFGFVETDITNCLITLRGAAAFSVGFLEKFGLIDVKANWKAVKLEYPPEVLAEWKASVYRTKIVN